MKYSALFKILIVTLIGTLSVAGQSNCPPFHPQTQVAASTVGGANGRDVQYNISGLSNNCSMAFYLFGDGHFSSLDNPAHEFYQPGTYETKYYALGAYVPTIPPEKNIDWVNNNPVPLIPVGGVGKGSSTSNQLFRNGLPVDLGQSWRTAEGNHLIYIISFKHPGNSTVPANGNLKLELDPRVTFLRTIGENNMPHPHNNWADLATSTGYDPNDHTVNWTFHNVKHGGQDIRHLYVEVMVDPNTYRGIVGAKASIDFPNLGLFDISHMTREPVMQNPHDPNKITVLEDCAQANIDTDQTLHYRIDFQNEGNGYARDVVVETIFGGHVQLSTMTVTGSSDPISAAYINAAGNLEFVFDEIYLPGLRQSYPNTYKPNQTTGYVEFTICTKNQLPPKGKIAAFAQIFFDNLAPVVTNHSILSIEDFCPVYSSCDNSGVDALKVGATASVPQVVKTSVSPNPFGDQFVVNYSVPEEGSSVSIRLHSLSGQQLNLVVFEGFQSGGAHHLEYSTDHLPAGIYLMDIRTGAQRETLRIVKTR